MLAALLFIPVWLVLSLVSAKLINNVVWGLFPPSFPVGDSSDSDNVKSILVEEASRYYVANFVVTMLAAGLTCGFLFALFHFWNVGLAIAAGTVMLSRLPDQLWQIQHGRPQSIRDMPQGTVYFGATVLAWLTLPVVWYSLYVGPV